MKLGVRPYRLKMESLTGYLMRLARSNGFLQLSAFLKALGMKPLKNRRMHYFTRREAELLKPLLDNALGRNADQDLKDFYTNAHWQFDSYRVFQHALVDFPRICPHCLVEHEQMDWRWQCAFLPLCPTHLTPIINDCPNCHTPLSWDTQIFGCCPACKFPWKTFDAEPLTGLAKEINELTPDKTGHLKLSDDQLRDLLLALMVIGRPNDLLHDNLIVTPASQAHWQRALSAWQLLHQPDFWQAWESHLKTKWPAAYCASIIQLIKSKFRDHSWPALQEELEGANTKNTAQLCPRSDWPELTAYLKPSRLRQSRQASIEEQHIYRQVNHPVLAELLGISSSALMSLTEASLFPQLNSTNVVRDKLFDVQKITNVMSKHNAGLDNRTILLRENSSCFKRYLTNLGELLAAGFSGKLKIKLLDEHSLGTVEVNVDDAQSFLQERFNHHCESSLNKTTAARALGCAPHELNSLTEKGLIQLAAWRSDGAIDGPSFKRYYTPPRLEKGN